MYVNCLLHIHSVEVGKDLVVFSAIDDFRALLAKSAFFTNVFSESPPYRVTIFVVASQFFARYLHYFVFCVLK